MIDRLQAQKCMIKTAAKALLNRLLIHPPETIFKPIANPVTAEVEAYYDRENDSYLSTYGKIIQASRPASDEEFIDYLIDAIGLEDGMQVLDAGCGVCGPAIEFAKRKKINVKAVTISGVQVDESNKNIIEANLTDRIQVTKGDFSLLEAIYPPESFDKIYFLETLGYANDFKKVLSSAAKVLKRGGSIYIKDFFEVPILEADKRTIQHQIIEQVRLEYLYKAVGIVELITAFRELGLYIEFVKPFAMIENFTKAATFEQQNNSHSIYTKAINAPFQLLEVLEVKFKKIL